MPDDRWTEEELKAYERWVMWGTWAWWVIVGLLVVAGVALGAILGVVCWALAVVV